MKHLKFDEGCCVYVPPAVRALFESSEHAIDDQLKEDLAAGKGNMSIASLVAEGNDNTTIVSLPSMWA